MPGVIMALGSFTCSQKQADRIRKAARNNLLDGERLLATTVYDEDEQFFYFRANYRDDSKSLISIRELKVVK